jgi:arylsulfatase
MAVYAAQIDRMDQGVGRVMAKLRELDMEDNTLVMFMSDNGGCAEFLREDGEPGRWPAHYGVPLRDGRMTIVGNCPARRPGGAETFMSYDLPWANASNSPFRKFKSWVHEGGISTPLIVHWPAAIKRPQIVHEYGHVVDIMPTCLDVAGAGYPSEFNGKAITPCAGESFAPLLKGQPWHRSAPIFWEHEGNRAVRQGNWKLVNAHPHAWELYDMATDRTELTDLFAANRPQADVMIRVYGEWAERCEVRDWPLR